MKKISYLLISAMALLMTACDDAGFEMHNTYFYPQLPDGMRIFADQTEDSTKVFSYDPWTAEVEAASPWFTITPTSCEARPGSKALTRVDLRMPQNTTGKNKQGRIVVSTYDNNKIAMPVYQCSWLNIMYPTAILRDTTYLEQSALFKLSVDAAQKKSTLTFHVYQNGATLTSDSDWATLPQTEYNKGTHNVDLMLKPNENKSERQAMLILTSGEISTPIYVIQKGKKDNK